ncbi:MAG: bifunctional methionine sulfoxide reductase B/A protein [Parcubacteria group bacterium]|nr:bifunctional methionine sulfoxide reductase B/A protein [Parcubacteria group bacterium]
MNLNKLTPEEEKIIIDKGTEAPFSGQYDNFFENGAYVCRRCSSPLYDSKDKFDAHCGWPSFDDEIKGAVKKTLDADGQRTEITCAHCGAHLGHLFLGEKLTQKNARYCVNSVSLKFIPKDKQEMAVFGGGCFWCVEAVFVMIRGVLSVEPGYAGGLKDKPTYEEVASGKTGHAEAVSINFASEIVSYDDLLGVFFYTHDPTSLNRQGHDIGTQYRSIILYTSEKQKQAAERYIKNLEKARVYEKKIITEVKALEKFYPAEDYHKNYFIKNQAAPYCQLVIAPKLAGAREKFESLLK